MNKVTNEKHPPTTIVVFSGKNLADLLQGGAAMHLRNVIIEASRGVKRIMLPSFVTSIHPVSGKNTIVISFGGQVYTCVSGEAKTLPPAVRDFLRQYT